MAMPKGELEAKLKEEHELISKGVLREENPLDVTDDFNSFLEACRRGDLKACQTYIASGGNINGKDAFDYTPLIIASLCGHYEVAQLLLESGAMAERNTFQGERCIHNALNDRIRNLLLRYDYSKSSDPLQPWAAHITSLLVPQVPKTSDITLTTAGTGWSPSTGYTGTQEFQLHKFLLAARTPYFRQKLTETLDLTTYRLSSQLPAAAFRIVLRYLYLADLTPNAKSGGLFLGGEQDTDDVDDEDEDADQEEEILRAVDRLSKQLKIEQLWEAMLAGSDRRLARQRYEDEVRRAQEQLTQFFSDGILGHKMVVETGKVNEVKWPHDNFIFADCLLCADEDDDDDDDNGEQEETKTNEGEAPLFLARANSIPIGPMAAEEHGDKSTTAALSSAPQQQQANGKATASKPPRRSVLYPAHKAMLVRSDYFRAMFSSAFLEAQASEHLRIIPVDCAPEVLEIVLSFLYTEEATIPLELALEVLYVADMLFLEKLKNKAAVVISTQGNGTRNVWKDPTTQPEKAGRKELNGDAQTQHSEVTNESEAPTETLIAETKREASAEDHAEARKLDLVNVYDVMHAAWALKVQRLEDFAARFLAERLEHYIDDPAFASLVMESAHRLKTREETDSIELVDDIRYFLSERFRMRFEDVAFSDMEDDVEVQDTEKGEVDGDAIRKEEGADLAAGVKETAEAAPAQTDADLSAGVLRDLDGNIVEDEFDSDALNYQILLGKIDKLLERLGLDG